jgi:hypothetical protein
VKRVDRGPLLLVVAGILLLTAVVAYLISDAEANYQRREAAIRVREAPRALARRSVEPQEGSDRASKARAELDVQHEAILKSLARIERLLKAMAPAGHGG